MLALSHMMGFPVKTRAKLTIPAPMVSWGTSNGFLGIGLGDVLLATLFPLVMRKAFGRAAGIAAMVIALLAIGTMLALPLKIVFPALVVLGPLMALQYIYWRRQRGQERTTWQYLQEEPLGLHGIRSRPRAGTVVR